MTDFTWNISFQLTGTFENTSLQQTLNVPATVTGTIVTDSDSGFLQPGDIISWSFAYSAPSVGFAGSASSATGGTPAIAGDVLFASGDALSYVVDPGTGGAHAFFTDAPSQVAFGIDLNFHDFVQGDIRLQDAFFDQLDATVTQPFQIGTEVVATLADISVVDTGQIDIDLSTIVDVSGNVTITGNTNATTVNMNSLTTVGGDVTITGNTSVTTIDAGGLITIGGDVTITSGADAALDASALGPGGGTVELIGDNLTTAIKLGSLDHMQGTLSISSADGVSLTAHAGLAELDIAGTATDNTLIGSATAKNVIDAGGGNDMMSGGAADDAFVFDFSISQNTVQHHDFVSLANITSVAIGGSIYFEPAPNASITAWKVWDNALTTYANSQADNTGGDQFTAFTNSNPAAKNVGTIKLIDGYFHDHSTAVTDLTGSGFDTITNFANHALSVTNGGGGNDGLVFNGLSTDQSALDYWGNWLSSTTANGNTVIDVHDVAHNGADVSSITLVGVTTDVATLVNQHVITFGTVGDLQV